MAKRTGYSTNRGGNKKGRTDPALARADEKTEREARGPHPKHSGTPTEPSETTMKNAATQANAAAEAIKKS